MPGRAYLDGLDGEIAVLTAEGISDFEALQVAPGRSAKGRWPRGIILLRERCRHAGDWSPRRVMGQTSRQGAVTIPQAGCSSLAGGVPTRFCRGAHQHSPAPSALLVPIARPMRQLILILESLHGAYP